MKVFCLLLAVCLVVACGGGGGSALVGNPPTITISPDQGQTGIRTAPSGTIQFSATAPGPVAWSASRGSIDADGLFTAPATMGNCKITASLVSDPSVTAHQDVSVEIRRTLKFTVRNMSPDPVGMSFVPGSGASGVIAPGQSKSGTFDFIFKEEADVQLVAQAQGGGRDTYNVTPADMRDQTFTGLTATLDARGFSLTITRD